MEGVEEIILDSGVDLGIPDVLQIEYKKPSGAVGFWPATVTEITKARAKVNNGELDELGEWTFQLYVEQPGGWKGRGGKCVKEIGIFECPICGSNEVWMRSDCKKCVWRSDMGPLRFAVAKALWKG